MTARRALGALLAAGIGLGAACGPGEAPAPAADAAGEPAPRAPGDPEAAPTAGQAAAQAVVRRASPEDVAAPARDREPNDTREQALVLVPERTVTGFVDAPADPAEGDQDWYVLRVPPGNPQVVGVSLEGAEDLDLVLEWMPAEAPARGKDRAWVQADVHVKEPGPEALPNLRVGPGPVYLRVREAWYRGKARTGSERPYRLTARMTELVEGTEAEPDDTPEQAVRLPEGERASGLLGHVGDVDVWRVALGAGTAGEAVRVRLDAPPGVTLGAALALPDGRSLGEGEANGPGEALVFRHVGLPRAGAEALLVTLRAAKGANPREPYAVAVETERRTDDLVEVEPNDAPSQATPVGRPGQVVGRLDRPGDVDRFELPVRERKALHLSLAAPDGPDVALTLLGPDGVERVRVDEARAGGPELLRSYLVEPGTWTVVVSGHDRKAFDPDRPWALDLALEEPSGGETEPNDAADSPTLAELRLDGDARGYLHPRGDVDWWRLVVKGEEGRIVTLLVAPPEGVVLDLAIHGAGGERVAGRDRISGPGAESFTHYLGPGTWLVRVAGGQGSGTNARTPYVITVLE